MVLSRRLSCYQPALAGLLDDGFSPCSPLKRLKPGREARLKPARDDARYQGKVAVWYPYHPLFGKQNLSVLRRSGSAEVEYWEIESGKERQFVPAWMLDADRCTQMTCGLQPAVDLASLIELAEWLRALDL